METAEATRPGTRDWVTRPLPEIVLPAQFFARAGGALQPEKRLMLAVLESAVWLVLVGGRRRSRCGAAAEAEQWLASDATDWPFSFVNVCDVLGLDPGYVRAGVVRRATVTRARGGRAPGSGHFPFRRVAATRHQVKAALG